MSGYLVVFIERLVSGLKAKLGGQHGGLLVRFGEAILGEAKSQANEMRCTVIQLLRSSLIDKNWTERTDLYVLQRSQLFVASHKPLAIYSHEW